MSESKVPGRKTEGKPFVAPAGRTAPAAAKAAASAPVRPAPKSAIEVVPVPEPTLTEKIESAVAPAATPDEPAVVAAVEDVPAPAPAVAETMAVPISAVTPAAEPDPIVSAKPEDFTLPKPDAAATMPFAPAMTRGIFDMATTFDAATTPAAAAEKVKAMFGGLNDRAKTAMEKSAKLSEELGELTKGNVEAIVASGKVAAKGAETMAQGAAEYGKKNFESATAMFKSLAGAKSPTELFQLQSDYAKTSFDSVVAEASKLSEAWVKLAGEMVQPISNRYAVAAEKIKAASL